jgi:hypothetical protein
MTEQVETKTPRQLMEVQAIEDDAISSAIGIAKDVDRQFRGLIINRSPNAGYLTNGVHFSTLEDRAFFKSRCLAELRARLEEALADLEKTI